MKKSIVLFSLLVPGIAQSSLPDISMIYSLGLTAGGDTLAERSDGVVLESGGLMYMSLGGVLKLSESFHVQANFGYHFDELQASNGSANFDRTFAEVIPFLMLSQKARIGFGVVNAFSPEYSDPSGRIGFENSFGTVSEINFQHSRKSWWGLRYVNMEYTVNSLNGFSVSNGPVIDGSYLGLMLHGGF